jgi:hypothetical protein
MLRKTNVVAQQLAATTATIAPGFFSIVSPTRVYAWLDSGLKNIVPRFHPNGM